MLGFLKKIFGLPTDAEVKAAQEAKATPYKVEPLVVNNKTGDIVETASVPPELHSAPVLQAVNGQITDAVTQSAPTKKTRKPRAPKVEKLAKEKATKPVKAAAKKVPAKRSKKA